jgi:hypothetical protein
MNTQKPAPQMTGFYVGATGSSYGFWNVWNAKSPAEFDVSEEYRNSSTLIILVQTTSGQKCGFCLMCKSKGVKYFEFDLEESHEVKQSDEDSTCLESPQVEAAGIASRFRSWPLRFLIGLPGSQNMGRAYSAEDGNPVEQNKDARQIFGRGSRWAFSAISGTLCSHSMAMR